MSQVPESLLQAIQAVSFADEEAGAWRLRLPDALATVTRWWEQHRVLVLDACGPQCPSFQKNGDSSFCLHPQGWFLPHKHFGQPCVVLQERDNCPEGRQP